MFRAESAYRAARRANHLAERDIQKRMDQHGAARFAWDSEGRDHEAALALAHRAERKKRQAEDDAHAAYLLTRADLKPDDAHSARLADWGKVESARETDDRVRADAEYEWRFQRGVERREFDKQYGELRLALDANHAESRDLQDEYAANHERWKAEEARVAKAQDSVMKGVLPWPRTAAM